MSISFWENIYQISKYKKIVAGISEYLHEYQNVEGYFHQYQNVKENLHKYHNMEEYLLNYSNLRRSEFLTLICIWILSNWFRACTEVFAWFMSLLNLIKSWYFLLFKTIFCSLKLFVVLIFNSLCSPDCCHQRHCPLLLKILSFWGCDKPSTGINHPTIKLKNNRLAGIPHICH